MRRGYSIGELAELSGASVRSLRFYEEAGLLNPERDPANGYRRYSEADVDRLQEILLLRRLDMPVRDIAPLLSTSKAGRRMVLQHHLAALKRERDRLNTLITTVEYTLAEERGETTMQDSEKFEGLKQNLVDESTRKMLNMSEKDFAAWQELSAEIVSALEEAVRSGADPAGPEGARVCDLHRRWLGYTWPSYTAVAHRGLAEAYVADERFTAYYDGTVVGCAAWLRDAIVAHAR